MVKRRQADMAGALAGRDEQKATVVDRDARDAREPLERPLVDAPLEVDDLDGVVDRVGDVEPIRVHARVVEAARRPMRREHDGADGAQGHAQPAFRNWPSGWPFATHCWQ